MALYPKEASPQMVEAEYLSRASHRLYKKRAKIIEFLR